MLNAVLFNNQGTLDLCSDLQKQMGTKRTVFLTMTTENLSNRQSIDLDRTALLGHISTFAKNLGYGIIIVLLTETPRMYPNHLIISSKIFLSNQISSS